MQDALVGILDASCGEHECYAFRIGGNWEGSAAAEKSCSDLRIGGVVVFAMLTWEEEKDEPIERR